MPDNRIDVNRVGWSVVRLEKQVDDLHEQIRELCGEDGPFVRKSDFLPVRLLVYGFVGIVLVAVVGALIALVVSR